MGITNKKRDEYIEAHHVFSLFVDTSSAVRCYHFKPENT